MRLQPPSTLALLLAALTVSGCSHPPAAAPAAPPPATAGQPAVPKDDVRRIDVDAAHALFAKGEAVIIDVRPAGVYADAHIRGAESIPLDDIITRQAELPKDVTVILYCSCVGDKGAFSAARRLHANLFNNTAVLVGGYPAWKKAGYPTEASQNQP